MATTSIEWTKNVDGSQGKVWNWARGCSRVSDGCQNCYAERMAHRFSGKGQPYEGLTVLGKKGPRWKGEARFVREMLNLPLRTKKPTTWFTNSMSDPFHPDLTFEQITAVFGVMAATPRHTYQMLTKRPERAVEFFSWLRNRNGGVPLSGDEWASLSQSEMGDGSEESETDSFWSLREGFDVDSHGGRRAWPLPNVWLGVSVENQETADERIPLLLQLPSAVHFISAEPLLGPVTLDADWLLPRCKACGRHSQRGKCCEFEPDCTGGTVYSRQEQPALLDWVIAGGESGPGARPCKLDWLRGIVGECQEAGVAVFCKQLGAAPYLDGLGVRIAYPLHDRKGGTMEEWPKDLQVREMPNRLATNL